MAESTTLRERAMSTAVCPRCGGTLIPGAAESEPVCLNCGYVAYASGLTPHAVEAELSNRPSLPTAKASDVRHHTDSE
jgi:DNA-directed RNA polymerase subunit M/transcription elongation factor TFIIS